MPLRPPPPPMPHDAQLAVTPVRCMAAKAHNAGAITKKVFFDINSEPEGRRLAGRSCGRAPGSPPPPAPPPPLPAPAAWAPH
jgi:hypothetical protein